MPAICVLVLLYVCPHTAVYVSSVFLFSHQKISTALRPRSRYMPAIPYYYICVLIPLYVSWYYSICVRILHVPSVLVQLYVCPHSTKYVYSYRYICVLILYMWPHTTICSCVLILIFIYVSSYSVQPRTVSDLATRLASLLLLYSGFTTAILILIFICVRTQRAAATVSDLATKHVFFFQYGPASLIMHQ